MKTTFHNNLKAFTLCAGFFSLVACREKSTIKPDLIPDVDNINTFEVNNFNMTVQNSYFDSLRTNDYEYPLVAVGGITNDNFFGKTQGGVYMQFIPPSDGFAFTAGTTVDSVVLSVPFLGLTYGDTSRTDLNHNLKLRVNEITDDFSYGDGTAKFYTFSKLNYNTTPVGSATIPVKALYDTTILASKDTVTRLLRMRVDALGSSFLNMGADLASTTAFLARFKGLYLGPDTTAVQNTMAYLGVFQGSTSVNYTNAQIELYAHIPGDTTLKRYFFRFAEGYTAFFNGIYRNYTGFPAHNYLGIPTVNSDSLIIQGYPGYRSDITVKIDNIPPAVINKATITITALKTGDDARFNAPTQLLITAFDDNGTERVVADMLNNDGTANTSGQGFVGGTPTKVTINGTEFVRYTLNIPREVQKAVSEGKNELKLRISSSSTYPGAFRMIGAGPNNSNPDTRLKLNIIYTKLK